MRNFARRWASPPLTPWGRLLSPRAHLRLAKSAWGQGVPAAPGARVGLIDALHADIGERKNLAATHPEKVKRLHADLVAWRQRVDAAMARMKTAEELAHPEELKQRKRRKTP